MDIHIME